MPLITGLDLETTGLEQQDGHRIVEIALVMYDFETRKRLGAYVKRVNPQRSIDPKAQAVHGITMSDLIGQPTWEEVAPMVVRIMNKSSLLVAHNGDFFDFPFVGMELLRIGQSVPNINGFDTMVHARWATPTGKSPNLGELCFALGVEYDASRAHGAEYDVDVMMQCFFRGVEFGFYKPPLAASNEAA